jgi:hypothetical protein
MLFLSTGPGRDETVIRQAQRKTVINPLRKTLVPHLIVGQRHCPFGRGKGIFVVLRLGVCVERGEMRKGVSPKPAETTTEEDVRSYILKRKNEGTARPHSGCYVRAAPNGQILIICAFCRCRSCP